MARAEGTIFVHRPARSTLFRYNAPYTMEQFFELARSELYPDTRGKLQLRISPSEAFRKEAKLLAPVSENKGGYMRLDSKGRTLEEWWKEEILDKWLAPEEDVWAIKILVSVDLEKHNFIELIDANPRIPSASLMALKSTRRLRSGICLELGA